ncbi:MAG TPA: AI-2E family transporter [Bacteroidales bacterium]|nr:AI-2E family transporter [Bacteroidales bacterium]HNS45992.1 AI-2E family transporter [Bacteroidales bacterium]
MDRLNKYLIAGASCVILAAGLHQIASLVNPFLLSLLLAFAILPLTNWMIRIKIPKYGAVALTFILVLVVGTLVSILVGNSIVRFINDLPAYEVKVRALYSTVNEWFVSMGIDTSKLWSWGIFDPARILTLASSTLSRIASMLSGFFFISILVVVFLFEFLVLNKKMAGGALRNHLVLSRFGPFSNDITKYLSVTALSGFISSLADLILLWILGIEYAILWAVLAWFLSFIPTIGFIISMIPPALLALILFGWQKALILIAGYVIINTISDNVVRPLFMKEGLKISFLELFISLIFWTFLLGIIGGIVSVPLTMAVKEVFAALSDDQKTEDSSQKSILVAKTKRGIGIGRRKGSR